MTDLRDKIAAVIADTLGEEHPMDEHVADAIVAALPTLVKPLVWDRGIVDCARLAQGGKYVACSTTPHGSWAWWLDGDSESREVHNSEEAAKAAANAHNAAAVVAAITGVTP